jgi:hypothetical protein
MVHLGATWGQRLIWVQTGDLKHTHTESEKRESVPRVSTSLVHLTHVGPTYLTSGSHLCHVAVNQWSMSAATSPGRDKCPDLIGPHHWLHQHKLPHGSLCRVHSSKGGAKWQHTERPPHSGCATWHHTTRPHHSGCATWHHTTRPPHSVYAT